MPQQINLDLIQAVSFEKGCYPGQEIVVRMHYLRETKTKIFLLVSPTFQLEEPTLIHERPIRIYSKNNQMKRKLILITFSNYAFHGKKLLFMD
ncbi:MAG: hypothetical protein CM15mP58_18220 [Burkholderiaceae bacterium]|nr:MAG: hypothetical protein CM15mP58_18220 [Burkholderiaceae bacterium]